MQVVWGLQPSVIATLAHITANMAAPTEPHDASPAPEAAQSLARHEQRTGDVPVAGSGLLAAKLQQQRTRRRRSTSISEVTELTTTQSSVHDNPMFGPQGNAMDGVPHGGNVAQDGLTMYPSAAQGLADRQ